MEREGIAAFLITVLGAACVVLLALGPVVYVYTHGFGGALPGQVDGAKDSQRDAERAEVENAEREAETDRLGLRQRYAVHSYFSDAYNTLYRDRDFPTVEARLEEQFAKSADPYEAHLYGRGIARLTRLDGGFEHDHMASVLDEWVAGAPDSYRARLLRGLFRIRLGQFYRGDGYASSVTSRSWNRMREQMELARVDLEAARDLNPNDPEIHVNLGAMARYVEGDRDDVERHFAQAIALQPLSLSARIGRLTSAMPKWGGSWAEVDAVLAECEASSQPFPLLMIVKREAERQMGERSSTHKEVLGTNEKKGEWAEPYLRQLELNPGDPMLMSNAAYFLGEAERHAEAEAMFNALGENYYDGSNFSDLFHYNSLRAYIGACVAHSHPDHNEGRRRALEALEMAPNHYYTNHVYGKALLRDGNPEAAARHFEMSRLARPRYPWSTVGLAECAQMRGDWTSALDYARQVFDLDPMPGVREAAEKIIRQNS